jgi:hypothetical protein
MAVTVEKPASSFKEKLELWHTSPDGEHYCPCCWTRYIKQFPKGERIIVEQNSMPTAEAIGDRPSVFCCRCGEQVIK